MHLFWNPLNINSINTRFYDIRKITLTRPLHLFISQFSSCITRSVQSKYSSEYSSSIVYRIFAYSASQNSSAIFPYIGTFVRACAAFDGRDISICFRTSPTGDEAGFANALTTSRFAAGFCLHPRVHHPESFPIGVILYRAKPHNAHTHRGRRDNTSEIYSRGARQFIALIPRDIKTCCAILHYR